MDESDRLIDSRAGFHDALHTAFENIARAGCREVLLCDEDFADWPLGSPKTVALLTGWARSHRAFHVVARHFDDLARRHPRWVVWRRQWSHVVRCRAVGDGADLAGTPASVTLPCLLVVPGLLALRLSDRMHFRGRLTTQPDDILLWHQRFDAISQHSADAFPATTLGL